MRILHTSDWHLGHTLHDLPREHEHQRFLDWLLEAIGEHGIDALLVAGDVFDTANPSAAAQAMFYRFVAKARRLHERLEIVVVGGNHDSADRLDAPEPLLDGFDIRVVGGLPRTAERKLNLDRLLVPLRGRDGSVAAWVAAVPFLRPADLPPVDGDPAEGEPVDPLIEGVRSIYGEVLEAALSRREPGEAIVAMGHLYMTGTKISELSERKILGGNQHALPVELFPETVAYAALGHLHLPQAVGRESVRYSGSPIPLSMAEIDYPHQVCIVDLEGERLAGVRSLRIPRAVELLRVPKKGALKVPELLEALEALPDRKAGVDPSELPYLEVRALLERPDPGLRSQVEAVVARKAARLVKLGLETTGDGKALADRLAQQMLDELLPHQVFENRWRKDHEEPMPEELLAAFHELVDEVGQRAGAGRNG